MKLTMVFLKNHYKKILPIYLSLAHLSHLSADILKEDKNKKIVVDYLVIGPEPLVLT